MTRGGTLALVAAFALEVGCGRLGFDAFGDDVVPDAAPTTDAGAADAIMTVTLYVSPNGDDSNPGTEAEPLLTLQEAADRAGPGTRVNIAAGLYDRFTLTTSGFDTAPIEFIGAGGDATQVQSENALPSIELIGTSYVVLRDIRVEGVDVGVQVDGSDSGTQSVRLERMTIAGPATLARVTDVKELVVVDSSLVDAFVALEIIGGGSDFATITGNQLAGGTTSLRLDAEDGDAIESPYVAGNRIEGGGIDARGVVMGKFENNLVSTFDVAALSIGPAVNANSSGCAVVNNTMVVEMGNVTELFAGQGAAAHVVFNNVLWVRPGVVGASIATAGPNDVQTDRNAVVDGFLINDTRIPLTQWQGMGLGMSSFLGAEIGLFVDLPTMPEPPEVGSMITNTGLAEFAGVLAPTSDINGIQRPVGNVYDIGAWER